MKKSLLYSLLAGAVAIAIVSCEKNNLVIDQDVTPPSFAKFNTLGNADTAGVYYIKATNEPFKIPIGVTNVSDQNRTIQLAYTSRTAAQGAQYNAPTTLTIPAGKAVDTLVINGLFSGYPSATRIDTVFIKISGGDAGVSSYKNTYRLILRKYCDVSLAAFAGDYDNVMDGTYGPYSVTVTPGTSSGTTGFVTITTRVNLDWTDPANFKATIPDQAFYAPANWWIVGTTNGTFSSCEQTFKLRYKLYNKATGATLYDNQVTDIKR
jgi:hypothetical protein